MEFKLNVINNNIVVLFSESITSSFKTDLVETKIADIYKDENPRPAITKFPEQVAVLIPEVAVSVIALNNNLTITDQNIGDFSKKDILKFIRLLSSINSDVINAPIKAYGYNYSYEIEGEFKELIKKISENYYSSEFDGQKLEGAEFKYLLPYLFFSKDEKIILIKFDIIINSENEEQNKLRISSNVHHDSESLPSIEELNSDYGEMESYISDYIKNIFNS